MDNFILFIIYFAQNFLEANSADPDQIPLTAASELGLHCLHVLRMGLQSKKG